MSGPNLKTFISLPCIIHEGRATDLSVLKPLTENICLYHIVEIPPGSNCGEAGNLSNLIARERLF
jgi:hypothetical protein